MSQFKDKLKMFESKGTAPPIKPKPIGTKLNLPMDSPTISSNSTEGIIVTNGKLNEELENISPNYYSSDSGVTEKEKIVLDTYSNDTTYELLGSVFDLPGLEIFDFDAHCPTTEIEICTHVPDNDIFQEEVYEEQLTDNESADVPDEPVIKDVQLAPSQQLVEEIVIVSLLRNSQLINDDNISVSTKMREQDDAHVYVLESLSSKEDGGKTDSPRKRNIFTGIFKSKKEKKKCANQYISDNESVHSNSKRMTKDDGNGDDKTPKSCTNKPLNSLLNRDWLNSIGEGVKKKATVMSELKKLFGKFKKDKKMSLTNGIDSNKKKTLKSKGNLNQLDLVYDEDIEECDTKNKGSDTDSIYDTEYDEEENQAEISRNKEKETPKTIVKDHINDASEVYASDEEELEDKPDKETKETISETKVISDNDSIYDNEEDTDEDNQIKTVVNIIKKDENIIKEKNEKPGKVDKKKISFPKISNKSETKQNEMYDEDGDIVEVYVSDIEDLNSKKITEGKPNNAKKISKGVDKSKTTKVKSVPKKLPAQSAKNDKNAVVVGENDQDDGDAIKVGEKKKSKKCVVKEKPVKKKNDTSKKINQKSSKQSDLYDEDIEVAEEYVSDTDPDRSKMADKKKVKETKNIKNEKSQTKVKASLPVTQNCAPDDIIYDNEDSEVESIYDNEEDDEEVPVSKIFNILSKKTAQKSDYVKTKKATVKEIHQDNVKIADPDEKNREKDKGSSGFQEIKRNNTPLVQEKKKVGEENHKVVNISQLQASLTKQNVITPYKASPNKAKEVRNDAFDQSLQETKNFEETEDEALKKLIKRNFDKAKKTFKLKEPIKLIASARALKTIYIESKTYIQFNTGEILDVLEYRNDLALVKNGVGKCGLTSTTNLQIIKSLL